MNRIKRVIKKILKGFKKYGFAETVKRIFNTAIYRIVVFIQKHQKSVITKHVDISQFENIIVFENNFGWGRLMKQRPQQIAENLPANTLMFYHSHDDDDYPGKSRIAKIKDNLVLIDLGYYRDILLKELSPHGNKYVMVYSTDYIEYSRLKMYEDYGYKIIYEYVDDINVDLMGNEMYRLLSSRHHKLLRDKNTYVVCTANKLLNNVKSESKKNAVLITNGGDYETFKYSEYDVPDDLKPIKEKYQTLICYYGALASWFDYELIAKTAQNKNYGIVLLGLDYDCTLEKSKVLDNENVYYLGRKQYNELPKYGCNCDILIIPFIINDITKSTNPVKIFEYMAMGKPIVTTALPECRKYKSVFISESHDDFIKNLEIAVNLDKNDEYFKTEETEALENTWTSKAENLVNFVSSQKYEELKETVEKALTDSRYDRVIVWRSPFGWNVPLYQRPQHIANQFSKKNCLVFYEVTPATDGVDTVKKEQNNLYLVNFSDAKVLETVNDALKKCSKPKYIQIYSTNWSMSLDEVNGFIADGYKILYEYIDDISPELAGTDELPQYILDKYNFAMSEKSVAVVTTAQQIYDDVVSKRGTENMVLSGNGVDYGYFQKYSKFKFENSFEKIVNNGKINMCYYGALASWFDYELIRKINATDKYNIILIGIKYDESYDKSNINKLKNVHFIGSREYKVLKYYANRMDILTIPFVINSITRATSPLKLFEYMALKKPIVTTAMDECKKYESVNVANTHEEFIEMLDNCSKQATDPEYMKLLEKEGKDNDWSKKAELIIKLLKSNE